MSSNRILLLSLVGVLVACDEAEPRPAAEAKPTESKTPEVDPETAARLAEQSEAIASLRALYNKVASTPASDWPEECPSTQGTAELLTFTGAGRVLGAAPGEFDGQERGFEPSYLLGFGTVERGFHPGTGHASAKTLLATDYVAVLRLTKAVDPQIVDEQGKALPLGDTITLSEVVFKPGKYDAWTYLMARADAKPLCVLKTSAKSTAFEKKGTLPAAALHDNLRDNLLATVTKGLGEAGLQLGSASMPTKATP